VQSIRAAITIDRPIHDVFGYVCDIRNDVQWCSTVKAVRTVSAVELGIGCRYELDVRLFGWRFTSGMRVTDFVPPGRMTMLSGHSGNLTYSGIYRLEPAKDGAGTLLILDVHFIASGYYRMFGPAFGPMLRRTVQRDFVVLKQVLESAPDRYDQASR